MTERRRKLFQVGQIAGTSLAVNRSFASRVFRFKSLSAQSNEPLSVTFDARAIEGAGSFLAGFKSCARRLARREDFLNFDTWILVERGGLRLQRFYQRKAISMRMPIAMTATIRSTSIMRTKGKKIAINDFVGSRRASLGATPGENSVTRLMWDVASVGGAFPPSSSTNRQPFSQRRLPLECGG
jgi:hypothetical protein